MDSVYIYNDCDGDGVEVVQFGVVLLDEGLDRDEHDHC